MFEGRQRKSMEKWEIRPPLPQKPLNRSSPKFAWWLRRGPYPYAKFHHDTITPFRPPPKYAKMRIKWRLVFWFFLLPTAKTIAPIFTLNTSNDVVSHKDVPFGDPGNKILHFYPIPSKKWKFLANFWRDLIDTYLLTVLHTYCTIPRCVYKFS